MNKIENKNDKIHSRSWNVAKVMNRITFLAMTERPFYVKRAVAREAIRSLLELK
ncbi:TPA: hypothetical protein HA219_01910 [Candidatus Woesearchaeota archaeon]|nr:hypothetical protein [Candidatus Woesearchaeota archaeon]